MTRKSKNVEKAFLKGGVCVREKETSRYERGNKEQVDWESEQLATLAAALLQIMPP